MRKRAASHDVGPETAIDWILVLLDDIDTLMGERAQGLTPDGIVARDKAREREHRAAKILDELCVLKEEVRQQQKRASHWSSTSPERAQARRDLRLAKEAFDRAIHLLLGSWS